MDAEFIRRRITELRMKKGVSEFQMSFDLGRSKGYIQGISSGKALPSMKQFLNICDYFEISPIEFFDYETEDPKLSQELLAELRKLDYAETKHLLEIVKDINKKH